MPKYYKRMIKLDSLELGIPNTEDKMDFPDVVCILKIYAEKKLYYSLLDLQATKALAAGIDRILSDHILIYTKDNDDVK